MSSKSNAKTAPKYTALTIAVMEMDEHLVKADAGARTLASKLFAKRDKANLAKTDVVTEADRLVAHLKATVARDGYEVQTRNFWLPIKQFLLCKLHGSAKLEIVKPIKGKKKKVLVVPNQITQVSEAAAAAKGIRAAAGKSDGRSNNAPPKKTGARTPQAQVSTQALVDLSGNGWEKSIKDVLAGTVDRKALFVRGLVANKAALIKACAAAGYTMTISEVAISKKPSGKKVVTRPAPKKAAQQASAAK